MTRTTMLQIALVAAVAGIAVGLLWISFGDGETVIVAEAPVTPAASADAVDGAAQPATLPTPVETTPQLGEPTVGSPPPTTAPTDAEPVSPTSPEPFDLLAIPDELIERAMADAAAAPLEGLPSRDMLATTLLENELLEAGFDLTGLDLVVYPPGNGQSMIFIDSSESTAMLANDGSSTASADPDTFAQQVLASQVLADLDIERFVMRYSGNDDDGAFVATFTAPLAELRDALANGDDPLQYVAAQVERP